MTLRTNAPNRPGGDIHGRGRCIGQRAAWCYGSNTTDRLPSCALCPVVDGREVRVSVPLTRYLKEGRDAALMVKNGTFRGLSVEFVKPSKKATLPASGRSRRARLAGAGLVDDPSYKGSRRCLSVMRRPGPMRTC